MGPWSASRSTSSTGWPVSVGWTAKSAVSSAPRTSSTPRPQLEPNSSAALLIWEDVWAAPFAAAVRNSGGVLLDGARIPHELIEPALAALPPAV